MRMIKVLGIEIPMYKDCPRCGAKEACEFKGVAYSIPCLKCQSTKEFQDEQREKDKNKLGSINHAFKVNKPAAMWEGRGRQIVTNYKGDIIANVPAKPRKPGRKDWKL